MRSPRRRSASVDSPGSDDAHLDHAPSPGATANARFASSARKALGTAAHCKVSGCLLWLLKSVRTAHARATHTEPTATRVLTLRASEPARRRRHPSAGAQGPSLTPGQATIPEPSLAVGVTRGPLPSVPGLSSAPDGALSSFKPPAAPHPKLTDRLPRLSPEPAFNPQSKAISYPS